MRLHPSPPEPSVSNLAVGRARCPLRRGGRLVVNTALLLSAAVSVAAVSVAPVAASRASARPEGDETVVWVRFRDRGPLERASFEERRRAARAQLSARSWERRARRAGSDQPLETDLPVAAAYLHALEAEGVGIRAVSRWKNAVSVVASPGDLERLQHLPFVAGFEPVLRVQRQAPEDWERSAYAAAGPRAGSGREGAVPFATQSDPGTPSFYGGSYAQNRIIGADLLHAQGLSGEGVLIVVLDTGFRETHTALDSLVVVARRDFINGDETVANETGQDPTGSNQESHGSYVLSTIAGYWPGVHVGTAYRAQIALGKTEYVPTETPVEMDYWQMGAEWADSLGADVLSSSLGYTVFDSPNPDYTYFDLDGETTVVTRAAAEAARRGITVVTAQGNSGSMAWHYLIAPADGDSVCAVGAVDSLGTIASFSSYGPTADGRVKPDVCAMGLSVQTVSVSSDVNFIRPAGTSFSTPATAGLAALLLEAHPTWGPFEVLEALRSTADRFETPDDRYGYGIARGAMALDWVPSTVSAPPALARGPALEVFAPPAGRAGLRFRLGAGERSGAAHLDLYDVRGRLVERVWAGDLTSGASAVIEWANPLGRSRGIYWARLVTTDGTASRRATLLW